MPERKTAALMSGAVTGVLVSTRKASNCAAAARTGCGTSGRVSAASTSAISGARPFCLATASRTMAVTAACKRLFRRSGISGSTNCTDAGNGLAFSTIAAAPGATLPARGIARCRNWPGLVDVA